MNAALTIPRPGAGIDVHGICQQIETWATDTTDIGELHEAKAKLSAIDSYIAQTSIEGRSTVSATIRRLEVRIGEVIGAGSRGGDRGNQHTGGKSTATDLPLSKDERSDFRNMAANADVVEDVIADSTDEQPASRRKVLDEIRHRNQPDPEPTSPSPRPRPIESDEEREARVDADQFRMDLHLIHSFCTTWPIMRYLHDNPRRERLLAALIPSDRKVVDEFVAGWAA